MDLFKKKEKTTTTCQKCSWSMTAAPFVPIVGGGPDVRLFRYIGALKEHIESAHPDVGMEIGAFSAFLIAAAFKFEDPFLLKTRSDLRYSLHKSTRVVQVSDEQIGERVARIEGLTPEQIEGLNFLIRDMRDVLTESGQYAPKEAPVSPLVTA